jgi:hypothetical protein
MCSTCRAARVTRNHWSTKRHRKMAQRVISVPKAPRIRHARDWDAERAEAMRASDPEWTWEELGA